MIERIVVPVDGSVLSEQALPFGILMARTFGSPIEIAHVVELPMHVTIADPAAVVSPDAIQEYLNGLAERVPGDLSTRTTIRSGRPHVELLALVDEVPGTMLVMATHGRGGVPRALLGSVADKVVHGGTTPIGLIRTNDTMPIVPERLQRIVIPLDGSELSEAALDLGSDLARRSGASLSLLRVIELFWATYAGGMNGVMATDPRLIDELMTEMEEDARSSLTMLSETLEGQGLTVDWSTANGRPLTEILRISVEKRADLILTTTHGRGGLSRLFLGSVATGLIQHSPVPLIVIPAGAVEAPDTTTA